MEVQISAILHLNIDIKCDAKLGFERAEGTEYADVHMLIEAAAQRLRAEQRKPAGTPRWPWTLTASCSVPGCSVDGAVFLRKVLSVADPLASVGHPAVGGRVGEGQPAEDVVIWSGAGLSGHPLGACFVIREGHHQLPSLEVTTQHKGYLFHPCYQSPGLHSNLKRRHKGVEENVIYATCGCRIKSHMLPAYSPICLSMFTGVEAGSHFCFFVW